MTQNDSPRPPRYCSNCGAKNPATAAVCGVCGQQLAVREDHARLWGTDTNVSPLDGGEIIDLYPTLDMSSQATTPFSQTRPFDPADFPPPPELKPAKAEKKVDPWSAGSSRLGTSIGGPGQPPVVRDEPPAPSGPRKGPPGCVLGCLAFVLIAAVAGFIAWGAIKSAISDRVQDELDVGITNEMRKIDAIPASNAGEIILTEDEVNADLKQYADAYQPIKNVRVTIDKSRIRVKFDLYGVTSTYSGGLAVKNGRIVVTNPDLNGRAGQIVEADEIAATFESELAELLNRSGLEPVDVELRNGSLVVTTAIQT